MEDGQDGTEEFKKHVNLFFDHCGATFQHNMLHAEFKRYDGTHDVPVFLTHVVK